MKTGVEGAKEMVLSRLAERSTNLLMTKRKNTENVPKKRQFLKFRKTKKMRFVLMFQGPLKQKIRFLAQKMYPLARGQTNK